MRRSPWHVRHYINAYYYTDIYGYGVINTPFGLYLRSSSACLDIVHLIDSLSGRDNDHSPPRIALRDSNPLVRVSSVSGAVRTRPTDHALVAATLACMRPSSASLCVKFAISESYCSYSGIFRARSSFSYFCERRF
jgi:hypothetical protein